MFFKDIYKPIPLVYNLVLAMLWRHPENVELEKVKVVHYCAAVRIHPAAIIPSHGADTGIMVLTSRGFVVMSAGIEAMEVHREGSEHGPEGHQRAGEKVVGRIP